MLDSLYSNTKIFVVDNESFLILCKTDSIRVANALCKGLVNATTMVVSIDQPMDLSKHYQLIQSRSVGKWGEGNAAKIDDSVPKNKKHQIKEVEITEDQLKKKELTNNRKYGLEHLEKGCARYSARLVNYIDDSVFYHFLSRALDDSSPEQETYSDLLKEWAEINGISPAGAYQELTMHYKSAGISVMKLHALWTKYVDRINELTDITDIHIMAINKFEVEMFLADV